MFQLTFYFSLRAVTHQVDIKKLVASKANCCAALRRLRLGKKGALEYTTKIPASGQLAYIYVCICVTRNRSPCQQVALLCLHHSIWEKEKPTTADTNRKQNSACLAFSLTSSHHRQFQFLHSRQPCCCENKVVLKCSAADWGWNSVNGAGH